MVAMVTRYVKVKRYVKVLGKIDASSQQLREGEREREKGVVNSGTKIAIIYITYIDEFVSKTEYLSPPYIATGMAGQTGKNNN